MHESKSVVVLDDATSPMQGAPTGPAVVDDSIYTSISDDEPAPKAQPELRPGIFSRVRLLDLNASNSDGVPVVTISAVVTTQDAGCAVACGTGADGVHHILVSRSGGDCLRPHAWATEIEDPAPTLRHMALSPDASQVLCVASDPVVLHIVELGGHDAAPGGGGANALLLQDHATGTLPGNASRTLCNGGLAWWRTKTGTDYAVLAHVSGVVAFVDLRTGVSVEVRFRDRLQSIQLVNDSRRVFLLLSFTHNWHRLVIEQQQDDDYGGSLTVVLPEYMRANGGAVPFPKEKLEHSPDTQLMVAMAGPAQLICAAYLPDLGQLELYDSDDALVGRHQLPRQLDQVALALPFLFVSRRAPASEKDAELVQKLANCSPF